MGEGGRGNFRQVYRQDVSNVATNIKEKSKLTKPRGQENLEFDKGINDFYFASSGWYNGIKFRK